MLGEPLHSTLNVFLLKNGLRNSILKATLQLRVESCAYQGIYEYLIRLEFLHAFCEYVLTFDPLTFLFALQP